MPKNWITFLCLLSLLCVMSHANAQPPAIPQNAKAVDSEAIKIKTPLKPRAFLPDLKVTQAEMTPKHPKVGRNITFTARIHNAGLKTAPASKAIIRVGGEYPGMVFDIPPLEPGHSYPIHRTHALDPVQYYRTTLIAHA